MSGKLLFLTLVIVSISAVAQITLKAGVSTPSFAGDIASGKRTAMPLSAVTNPYVVGGLGLYFLGASVWLLVLSKVDVSIAYPFVGLGFLLTTAFAWLFLEKTSVSCGCSERPWSRSVCALWHEVDSRSTS